jgi:hypothetical protein
MTVGAKGKAWLHGDGKRRLRGSGRGWGQRSVIVTRRYGRVVGILRRRFSFEYECGRFCEQFGHAGTRLGATLASADRISVGLPSSPLGKWLRM